MKWQKRQANPAVKVKEAQAERKRRQANPQVRNTQGKRQRRAANPQVRIRDAELRRRQLPETGGADARFKRDFLDRSFGHSCKVCDRLWFDDTLVKIGNTRNPESRANALGVRKREFPATSSTNFNSVEVPPVRDFVVTSAQHTVPEDHLEEAIFISSMSEDPAAQGASSVQCSLSRKFINQCRLWPSCK